MKNKKLVVIDCLDEKKSKLSSSNSIHNDGELKRHIRLKNIRDVLATTINCLLSQ